jgi:hypothetical protein
VTTRSWIWTALVAAFLGATLAIAPARASVVLAMDLAELVAGSRHIVIGTALDGHARYRDAGKVIVTDVRLRVREALKGDSHPGDTLVVTHLGGRLSDLALSVPGEASFQPGQPVLVFLRDSVFAGELQVVGMAQGLMALSDSGPDPTVLPGGQGMALVQRGADGKLRDAPDALWQPRPLQDVRDEIQRLLAATGAR